MSSEGCEIQMHPISGEQGPPSRMHVSTWSSSYGVRFIRYSSPREQKSSNPLLCESSAVYPLGVLVR